MATDAEIRLRSLKAASLILRGVPEHIDEAGVRQLFAGLDGLPPIAEEIVETARCGKPRPRRDRPRPVLVTFRNIESRAAAFKYCAHLKPYKMDDDLTPAQREARTDLKHEFVALRNKGYSPFWHGNAIMVHTTKGLFRHLPGTIPPGPPISKAANRGKAAGPQNESQSARQTQQLLGIAAETPAASVPDRLIGVQGRSQTEELKMTHEDDSSHLQPVEQPCSGKHHPIQSAYGCLHWLNIYGCVLQTFPLRDFGSSDLAVSIAGYPYALMDHSLRNSYGARICNLGLVWLCRVQAAKKE